MTTGEIIEAIKTNRLDLRESFVDYLMFLFDVENLEDDKYKDLLEKLEVYEATQTKYKLALDSEEIKYNLFHK